MVILTANSLLDDLYPFAMWSAMAEQRGDWQIDTI
jgi:hypothetical protein